MHPPGGMDYHSDPIQVLTTTSIHSVLPNQVLALHNKEPDIIIETADLVCLRVFTL
jgi:hypothetical protein